MPQLVLFDLGDTLIYRERSLVDFDVDLLKKYSDRETEEIADTVNREAAVSQGIYKFSVDGVRNEDEEMKVTRDFFVRVFEKLEIPLEEMKTFLEERKAEIRYKVFPRVKEMLARLRDRGYVLGVASNGRPSRRTVLKQLGLMEDFDPLQIYISDEIGFCKPDSDFFEYIEKHSGFDSFVLCDDETPVLKAAAERGWKTIETGPRKDVYNEVLSILINHENL